MFKIDCGTLKLHLTVASLITLSSVVHSQTVEFCNTTPKPIDLAFLFMLPVPVNQPYVWRTKGWYTVNSGECSVDINPEILGGTDKGALYFYGQQEDFANGRRKGWGGSGDLDSASGCIRDEGFDMLADCTIEFPKVKFKRVYLDGPSYSRTHSLGDKNSAKVPLKRDGVKAARDAAQAAVAAARASLPPPPPPPPPPRSAPTPTPTPAPAPVVAQKEPANCVRQSTIGTNFPKFTNICARPVEAKLSRQCSNGQIYAGWTLNFSANQTLEIDERVYFGSFCRVIPDGYSFTQSIVEQFYR